MNKEGDVKFLKIQTCVLRVNIHCDGCKQKVKKLLHKIDGVYTTNIDSELGKVTVSGDVDPATLIRKLVRAGKHAELWSAPKGGNMMNNNKQLNIQFQNMQLDNKKGQKDAKPPKGGGKDNQKNMPPLPPQMQHPQQQSKGFKDLKLPPLKGLNFPFNKDQKTVKFASQEDEDFSDDEFDDEELDEFDDDFDDEVAIKPQSFKGIPMKPPMSGHVPVQGHPFMNVPPNPAMNSKGGGGNGNKNIQVPIKGGGNNDGKNDGGGKKGGGNIRGGNQNPNQHQNGSGGKNGGKNGGGNNKNAPNNIPNGGAGNNHHPQEGKKGGGGGGGAPQKGGAGQGGFHEIDLRKNGGGGDMVGGPAGQMGYAGMPQAGQMGYPGMPPVGNMPAVQGMPMNAGGNFRPEMMASGGANPYQQQMLAQMMMQQQQRHNAGFQPMTYARPPPAVAYAPPYMPPPHYCPPTPEYTHYFSDENTNSCSVM